MKRLMTAVAAGAALNALAGAVPVVSEATMTQNRNSREVTIAYTLADAPAVVTLDIQTNATDGAWASIGGENVQNVTGDVWKKVEAGARTILWRPDLSWPNHRIAEGGARAVVTAWSLDNPPDYLVVDLSATAGAGSERYYPAAEFLPGGLLSNDDYRLSSLVLRKIPAKGVTWAMGNVRTEIGSTTDGRDDLHAVTLDDSYYIGVFPVTQAQWALVQTNRTAASEFYFQCEREMRPVDTVCYNEIRNAANATASGGAQYDWPHDPNPDSFLGILRTKTGFKFDLPSEAQWEFASRAGHGSGVWNDGTAITATENDVNVNRLGRNKYNGGLVGDAYAKPDKTLGAANGTAAVGSYEPNDWGIYDMHGNVWEWCLDWYELDITQRNGAVNVDSADPTKTLSGATGGERVRRGGSFEDRAANLRSARRAYSLPTARAYNYGFRLALPTASLLSE
mgnify:CR=1 FL=1